MLTGAPEGSTAEKDASAAEFAAYLAVSGQEQEEFADSFHSLRAFVQWYNAAKKACGRLRPDIEIDGQIIFGS